MLRIKELNHNNRCIKIKDVSSILNETQVNKLTSAHFRVARGAINADHGNEIVIRKLN